MRRTTPALPIEPIEPAKTLSQMIKGQHAGGRTLNPKPFTDSLSDNFFHFPP